MILNKKGFMMLPLAALLFATGCAKNVSYEEACKFVRENYTSKEEKTPTSGYLEIKCTAKNEDTKKMIKEYVKGITGIDLDDNLYAKQDLEKTFLLPQSPLTEDEIYHALDGQTGYEFTYTIKGKNFTQSYHFKDEQGESWYGEDYNDGGYLTKTYSKIAMSTGSDTATFEQSTHYSY